MSAQRGGGGHCCWGCLLLMGVASGCRSDAHERWAAPPATAPAETERRTPRPLPTPERPGRPILRPVPPQQLCITLGFSEEAALRPPWINRQPKLRATATDSAGAQAALSFRYLGPTASERPLGSGRLRRQLGLKLLAEDTCNLLYVMWRFDRPSRVAVSIKRNPQQQRHAQCANHGYRNIRPSWSVPVAAPAPQSVHDLSARVQQSQLEVSIDGQLVLRADLTGERLPERGQAGLRSDNVAFELIRFEADLLRAPPSASAAPCRARRSGSEGLD